MKLECSFTCIDGNVAKRNVVAYCNHHCGFLTKSLRQTHRCLERNCKKYVKVHEAVDGMFEEAGIEISFDDLLDMYA